VGRATPTAPVKGSGARESRARVYIVGDVFYETVPGFKVPPLDTIGPMVHEELWHSAKPVNKVVCARCSGTIPSATEASESTEEMTPSE
jgi:hypothetical protein